MNGLMYVIEQLGQALARAEAETAALRERNAVLEQQLKATGDEQSSAR